MTTTIVVPQTSILATREGAMALASILILRLGGSVTITADDFASIAFTNFVEVTDDTDQLTLRVERPAESGPMQ